MSLFELERGRTKTIADHPKEKSAGGLFLRISKERIKKSRTEKKNKCDKFECGI